jgi:hypothetical protein
MLVRTQTIVLAALLVALLSSGCTVVAATGAPDPSLPELALTAVEYAYAGPDRVEAGLVTVSLTNQGQEPHHAQLARLPEGMAPEELMALFQEDALAAIQSLTYVGGPGLVDPGLSSQVVLDLTPGQYMVLSFWTDAEGVPNLARGMAMPFQAVAGAQADLPAPKADGTVKLLDFAFVLPSPIAAGRQTWQVVNEGQEIHEIMLMKLAEGATLDDAMAFLHAPRGEPPYANVGGFQAISPGETGWLQLDLEPGNYVALCYVPGAETGELHLAMGMIQQFTVE